MENILILASKLREEKRMKEGLTASIEQDKEEINLKEQELESKKSRLISFEDELKIKIFQRKEVEKQKQEIFSKIEEKKKLEQETEKTKIIISNKKESILENMKLMEQVRHEIDKLREISFDESKIPRTEIDLAYLKSKKQGLEEKKIKVIAQISSLNLKNKENEEIKENIKKFWKIS